uniref:VP2 n=1 Tax=Guadeloupe Culex rhabdovirus TaxID=2607740 RepID=A0A5C1K3N6_9RHAB|nr:VP2 [Guadeloupe Culex rhabdovirus]
MSSKKDNKASNLGEVLKRVRMRGNVETPQDLESLRRIANELPVSPNLLVEMKNQGKDLADVIDSIMEAGGIPGVDIREPVNPLAPTASQTGEVASLPGADQQLDDLFLDAQEEVSQTPMGSRASSLESLILDPGVGDESVPRLNPKAPTLTNGSAQPGSSSAFSLADHQDFSLSLESLHEGFGKASKIKTNSNCRMCQPDPVVQELLRYTDDQFELMMTFTGSHGGFFNPFSKVFDMGTYNQVLKGLKQGFSTIPILSELLDKCSGLTANQLFQRLRNLKSFIETIMFFHSLEDFGGLICAEIANVKTEARKRADNSQRESQEATSRHVIALTETINSFMEVFGENRQQLAKSSQNLLLVESAKKQQKGNSKFAQPPKAPEKFLLIMVPEPLEIVESKHESGYSILGEYDHAKFGNDYELIASFLRKNFEKVIQALKAGKADALRAQIMAKMGPYFSEEFLKLNNSVLP